MNKNAIKKFAIEARKKLIASVSDRAGMLGITPEGCSEPVSKGADFEVYKTIAGTEITLGKSQCEQRRKLKEQVETRGFEAVVEEVAYTWFNRICAIRFMEVNDYLPTRVRVLSSEKEGKNEPDIVTQAPDVDLDFTDRERENILDCKMNNKLDDLFKMLFIKQCNKLSEFLPELFEATEDYTEMLLNISYTNKDDIIYMLVNLETGIPEADFNVSTIGEDGRPTGQVEIIGWLYQYYNTELKDDTFAQLKKNVKISKERIPAATQLFTPDWIVRYMVENSVGRIWIEHLRAVDSSVNEKEVAERFGWKYYLPEAEQEEDVNIKLAEIRTSYKDLKPEDITCIDPCMGSGHILVAMFDVLMDIYKSAGYSERDAAFEIVKHNIHGLDIDKRAYQLAYFAVMMKARRYNRRILTVGIAPKLFAIKESNEIDNFTIEYFVDNDDELKKNVDTVINELKDATEYGSILKISEVDFELLYRRFDVIENDVHMYRGVALNMLLPIVKQAQVMAQKYKVVITNPPYMGGNYSQKLSNYLKEYYVDTKADFFSVFMEKCMHLSNDYVSMVTPESWMFLYTYLGLRKRYITTMRCVNCVHLGMKAFECGFGTVAFAFTKKRMEQYESKFVRLTDFSMEEKQYNLTKEKNEYVCSTEQFKLLPNEIMAYWCSLSFAKKLSEANPFGEYYELNPGIKTGNNDLFLRLWQEVNFQKISYTPTEIDLKSGQHKWYFYNKGGGYRKWYGGYEYVVDFENNAQNIRNRVSKDTYRLRNPENYFIKGILWPLIGNDKFSSRYLPSNVLSDITSNTIHFHGDYHYEAMAFMNSSIFNMILNMINPTVSYPIDSIYKVPYNPTDDSAVKLLVIDNISLAQQAWDSFETSWDFKKHPLVQCASFTSQEIATDEEKHISDMGLIRDAYELWNDKCESSFNQLKANEEELNRIFIDIYGLQDELTPDVEDKDVTIRKADLQREIKSLLSYAVGCMFGRYSLDCEGIAYAGGEWDDSKYETFNPDKDNCIPITDDEYSEDDIVGRLCEWLKKVYGAETLEENLDFIAKALGNKGKTSRETIREYFVNDFMADHMRIYQKRPIYWLFDSGKANGFKALVYMHRYNADTVAKVRVDYLHNIQKSIEQAKLSAEYLRDNGSGAEKAKATKLITKYTKQLAEIHLYDEAMAHIASQRIDIDLDDGVKVNYEKFQGVEVAQEGKKALKVDLLAKIK